MSTTRRASGRYAEGDEIEGYRLGRPLHQGGNGYIFEVSHAPVDPGFPMVMKLPAVGRGEQATAIISFEIEQMILPTIFGSFVPRVVATGDVLNVPFIVMERIDGEGLQVIAERAPIEISAVAEIGASIADALHALHAEKVVHLDLKPENVIMRRDGTAVLLDFGYARHEGYPDLLAEEQRFAAGSAAYVSPEQLRGNRADPRSDVFALGAILYQLATGATPFGEPETIAGMRDRLWRDPVPPRAVRPDVPPWLQEVILRCLEAPTEQRYPSAALVAFDLRHESSVKLSARARRTTGPGLMRLLGRWWRHRRDAKAPMAAPKRSATPIIMVAVDTEHPEDVRHPALQAATRRVLAQDPDSRLMFVSVIRAAPIGDGDSAEESSSGKHLEHVARLRRWVEPFGLPATQVSLHAVESDSAADTLLEIARVNHAGLIILGAPSPSRAMLAWWRSVASDVTANAECSVYVVRAEAVGD